MNVNKHHKTIFFILILIIAGSLVWLQFSKHIQSKGKIKCINLEAYWDEECINPVMMVDWGLIGEGETVNQTLYLKNIGSTRCVISMYGNNWIPTNADEYFTLTWTGVNATLLVNEVEEFTISLHFSDGNVDFINFSFDLVFEATEIDDVISIS